MERNAGLCQPLCGKNVLGLRDTVLVLRTSRKGFIMATLKLRKENICVRLGGTIQESMRCQNGSRLSVVVGGDRRSVTGSLDA